MRLPISFAALFLSVVLLQLGPGGVAVLDAKSGTAFGFTTVQIGLLGSAHFFGFIVGCWRAPRLMDEICHSRAFAAFAAAGTIGILAHMLLIDPCARAVMRMASGLGVAGCRTINGALMQAKVTHPQKPGHGPQHTVTTGKPMTVGSGRRLRRLSRQPLRPSESGGRSARAERRARA